MRTRIGFDGDSMTAYLSGEIDHHCAKNTRELIDSLIQQKKPKVLRLDFSGVGFMDSSGIGLIIGRYRMMMLYGGYVRVVNVPEGLEKLMLLSGLGALDILERHGEAIETTE